jgi:hypothetical protein
MQCKCQKCGHAWVSKSSDAVRLYAQA